MNERSQRIGIFILVILLFLSHVNPICISTTKSLFIPSVVNENRSEMVQISVETKPGNGEVFVSVSPVVGFYTQQSEKIAAEVAFALSKKNDCDVFLRIHVPDEINQVDGPSGGAAITLLILSALEQKDLRKDFSITGTIERDGNIGLVGGIPLKAEAVAKLGKKLFLVPNLPWEDKLNLIIIKKFYNISVIEVNSIKKAYSISSSSLEVHEYPELTLPEESPRSFSTASLNLTTPSIEYFSKIAKNMISSVEEKIRYSSSSVKENFESRLKNAKEAYNTGNFYTAANSAFLLLIDSDLANFSETNMLKDNDEVENCINNFVSRNKSIENFEFTAAADLRYLWALSKKPTLKEIRASSSLDFVSPKLTIYNNLLFSKYWCKAATDFNKFNININSINESYFDESIAEELAKTLIIEASYLLKEKNITDEDLEWHLNISKKAFDKGLYVASIIDSSFVISAFKMENQEENNNETVIPTGQENVSATSANLTPSLSSFKHLWPQLYYNHAKTYEGRDNRTATRLYSFSLELEKNFRELENKIKIKKEMEEGKEKELEIVAKEEKRESDFYSILYLAYHFLEDGIREMEKEKYSIFLILLVILVLFFVYLILRYKQQKQEQRKKEDEKKEKNDRGKERKRKEKRKKEKEKNERSREK